MKLGVRTATPFFGFGLCDNVIMIFVGDAIDSTFGVTMGFSTMIAAGFGQAVSDGSGVTIQSLLERWSDRLGLPNPGLTPEQRDSSRVSWATQLFRTVGIVAGCLCGLVPVIIFDTGNEPRLYDRLLAGLPEDKRRIISKAATRCHFDAGAVIFKYGERCDALYTITGGEVRIVGRDDGGRELELCVQGPGHSLGSLELIFGHSIVADVIAVTPVSALRINKDVFDKHCGNLDTRRAVKEYVLHEPSFVAYRLRHTSELDSIV